MRWKGVFGFLAYMFGALAFIWGFLGEYDRAAFLMACSAVYFILADRHA